MKKRGPTRRQSQRRRLSRLVLAHESRQPPSWLTFDDRRKMMKNGAYLTLSVAAFLGAASMHVASYVTEVSRSFLDAAWVAAVLLSIPLILLFLRLKKKESDEQIWHRFWNAVIEYCPRWIWGSMSIAWLLAMISLLSGIFWIEPAPMVFHSALVLIPISAAFSYSVTLVRRVNAQPIQRDTDNDGATPHRV